MTSRAELLSRYCDFPLNCFSLGIEILVEFSLAGQVTSCPPTASLVLWLDRYLGAWRGFETNLPWLLEDLPTTFENAQAPRSTSQALDIPIMCVETKCAVRKSYLYVLLNWTP